MKYHYIQSIILAILSVFAATIFACEYSEEPRQLLECVSAETVDKLNKHKNEMKQDPTMIQRIIQQAILPHIDQFTASRKALLNEWKNLDQAQKKEFTQEFVRFLTQNISRQLAEYLNESNPVFDSKNIVFDKNIKRLSKTDVIVSSTLITEKSGDKNIKYYLRYDSEKGWRLFDVEIEGISFIKQYQVEFENKIKSADFATLLEFIKIQNKILIGEAH